MKAILTVLAIIVMAFATSGCEKEEICDTTKYYYTISWQEQDTTHWLVQGCNKSNRRKIDIELVRALDLQVLDVVYINP